MCESREPQASEPPVSNQDMTVWLDDPRLDDDPCLDDGPWLDDDADAGETPEDETPEEEHAAWLRGLPDDIRAAYLSRPLAGPLETDPAGYWHHDIDPDTAGIGFASGGPLDMLPPGPELAGLAAATDAERAALGESALIGVLCAWQRLAAWAQAGQAATLMTLARRRDVQALEMQRPSLAEHVSDEVAAALRLTGRSANQLLATASGLARLPDVHGALRRGEIDWAKACLFVDLLTPLADDDAREIAARLLAGAGSMTSGQLRAALVRAVLAHDPEAAARRRKEARADSGVHTWTETSGNSALAGRELATNDVIHASAHLTAMARWLRKNGATETMDQLRAAVYVALLTGRSAESLLPPCPTPDTGIAPDTGGTAYPNPAGTPNPNSAANPAANTDPTSGHTGRNSWPQLTGTVNLTMPMSTWLGLTHDPGEVASLGPVDAETCRLLAHAMDAASRWCLTVTDAAGRAVAHACAPGGPPPRTGSSGREPPSREPPSRGGSRTILEWTARLAGRLQHLETSPCRHVQSSSSYRPSQSLRHLIVIRQRRCAFPGCRRPAARCDLDHTIPFDSGGRTCECNLSPLCRRHHQAKQAPRWHLDQPEPGVMTWRLPSGRIYRTAGDPY